FDIFARWTYDGVAWKGSNPTTVHVPARSASDAPTTFQVAVTVVNESAAASGTSSLIIKPFNLVTSAPRLEVDAADVTIHVAFEGCTQPNTVPTLVLPSDITAEAATQHGALVTFVVTATDAEDGDLTDAVVCVPASGSTFPLGETTVTCTVEDSEGGKTTGTFKVTV